ncbi:MAG: UvrD-helicase domain-containing protein, partial [Thermoguttaceae bacterium]
MATNAVKKAQPQWTDEQCRAIATRDVSVALSAGAGCGKTFVLTERFLAHLEPEKSAGAGHTRLGQLVAITFTERAAREMRERIREKCLKRLRDCPEDQADHWLCLLNELDSARISTIHSFCASLLRSHAVEAALDPRFRVLDQAQANTLLNESIDDFLRETLSTVGGESSDRTAISAEYARNEPCALFEAAVNLSARYGLRGVREMIAKLLNCRQEINWPSWRAVTVDNLLAKWRDYFNREALPQILRKICCSSAAKKVLEIARKKPCHHPIMRQRMTFLCEHLPRLTECDAPKKILSEIRDATIVKGAGTKKDWPNADLYEQYKIAVTKLRQIIDKQTVLTCFDPEAARPAAEMALQLLALADEAQKNYQSAKADRVVLDFNDLLINTRELLLDPSHKYLRKRLAANLRLLLVDEFQDTDPLQVELVRALCDNEVTRGKLFFVGDYKQSIYRFRGAQPHVFRRLREDMPPNGRMPLSLNFRSQPAILDFVNALFSGYFGQNYEPLRAYRKQSSDRPAVEFLWAAKADFIDSKAVNDPDSAANTELSASTADDATEDNQPPAERRRRREADWIARRIRVMLDSGKKIVGDSHSGVSALRGA